MNQQNFHTSAVIFEKRLKERGANEAVDAPNKKTSSFSLWKWLAALLGRKAKREVRAPRTALGSAGKFSKLK